MAVSYLKHSKVSRLRPGVRPRDRLTAAPALPDPVHPRPRSPLPPPCAPCPVARYARSPRPGSPRSLLTALSPGPGPRSHAVPAPRSLRRRRRRPKSLHRTTAKATRGACRRPVQFLTLHAASDTRKMKLLYHFPATPGRSSPSPRSPRRQPRAAPAPAKAAAAAVARQPRLWPLAALVTSETRQAAAQPQDKSAGAFLWRGRAFPIGCASLRLGCTPSPEALSLQAGRPAGESFSENVCRVPCHLGQSGPSSAKCLTLWGCSMFAFQQVTSGRVPAAGVL